VRRDACVSPMFGVSVPFLSFAVEIECKIGTALVFVFLLSLFFLLSTQQVSVYEKQFDSKRLIVLR
jgi:hypothetical protein